MRGIRLGIKQQEKGGQQHPYRFGAANTLTSLRGSFQAALNARCL